MAVSPSYKFNICPGFCSRNVTFILYKYCSQTCYALKWKLLRCGDRVQKTKTEVLCKCRICEYVTITETRWVFLYLFFNSYFCFRIFCLSQDPFFLQVQRRELGTSCTFYLGGLDCQFSLLH